ncbi:MAG: chemotaxis protein CheW [Pseudomonadota bacterium]
MNPSTHLTAIANPPAPDGRYLAPSQRFLVFRLGQDHYGLDIGRVNKLVDYRALTRIHDGRGLVEGVAMVDDAIVALVDLRFPQPAASNRLTAVIVLALSGHNVGIVVDDVTDVVMPSSSQIRPMPPGEGDNSYLTGVATVGRRDLILLDIERLLAGAPAAAPVQRAA